MSQQAPPSPGPQSQAHVSLLLCMCSVGIAENGVARRVDWIVRIESKAGGSRIKEIEMRYTAQWKG